jgi:L-ascorbate metabolism protein UlaG (beta-lactamase superfamily)
MVNKILIFGFLCMAIASLCQAQTEFTSDIIQTSEGDLKITFLGHGTLMFQFKGKIIHVDPVSDQADYSKLPKADLIFITHEHGDHFDVKVVAMIRKESTDLILTETCSGQIKDGTVMRNGDSDSFQDIKVEAIPAYNIKNLRNGGIPFHPKGQGNGYILTFGNKRVYVAGDTENTPEMKALQGIDIAFLPMNLPYTMSPEMVADAAKAFQPKILYPYHYGKTDTSELVKLLKDVEGVEVRIR